MKTMARRPRKPASELEELRSRLELAEQTLEAIRSGEVDALLVAGPGGDKVFTLKAADKPYRLLIEAMNEGALTVLLDGTILYCNNRFAQMVRRPIGTVIGGSIFDFIEPRKRPLLKTSLRAVPPEGAKSEFTLQGELPLVVQLSLSAVEIESGNAVAVVATDLTERKNYEWLLQRQNADLERRVTERTADLKASNTALRIAQQELSRQALKLEEEVAARTSELQESMKSLEQFCYTIAHDLRAPLRAMHGFSSALVDECGPQLDDRGRGYARRIVEAAGRMDALIRDLLAYGRLNSGELPLVRTDLNLLVDQFVTSEQAAAAKINVQAPLPKVTANPTALKQVLENLLANATKFVLPGVVPQVEVFAKERNGWVRVHIKDNGIGIDPQYHERIFRVFERLSGKEYPGTGIGLAIVQKGVERMGGRAGVESEPGKGSCFWIELPKA